MNQLFIILIGQRLIVIHVKHREILELGFEFFIR